METPNTKNGNATEQIMSIFYGFTKPAIVELTTAQYNTTYSHVLDTLNKIYKSS